MRTWNGLDSLLAMKAENSLADGTNIVFSATWSYRISCILRRWFRCIMVSLVVFFLRTVAFTD